MRYDYQQVIISHARSVITAAHAAILDSLVGKTVTVSKPGQRSVLASHLTENLGMFTVGRYSFTAAQVAEIIASPGDNWVVRLA
jgi:hypothetical protein